MLNSELQVAQEVWHPQSPVAVSLTRPVGQISQEVAFEQVEQLWLQFEQVLLVVTGKNPVGQAVKHDP